MPQAGIHTFHPDVDMNLMGNHEENIGHRTSSNPTSKTTITDVKNYQHRHRQNPIDTERQITETYNQKSTSNTGTS